MARLVAFPCHQKHGAPRPVEHQARVVLRGLSENEHAGSRAAGGRRPASPVADAGEFQLGRRQGQAFLHQEPSARLMGQPFRQRPGIEPSRPRFPLRTRMTGTWNSSHEVGNLSYSATDTLTASASAATTASELGVPDGSTARTAPRAPEHHVGEVESEAERVGTRQLVDKPSAVIGGLARIAVGRGKPFRVPDLQRRVQQVAERDQTLSAGADGVGRRARRCAPAGT